MATAFWRPTQHELLLPWAHRYLDEIEQLGSGGGMLAVMSLLRSMVPVVGDASYLQRARDLAERPDQVPFARSTLFDGVDRLTRMLRARG